MGEYLITPLLSLPKSKEEEPCFFLKEYLHLLM